MSLLDVPLARLDGTPASLGELTGGKLSLVVNVASKCGLTPQYTALENIQGKYADRGFTVLGVPCNQFGGQEPGTAEEIAEFCSNTYGVSFPMTEKVDVNGPDQHPLFAELNQVADEQGAAGDVGWNFTKWLIAPDGTTLARFSPGVTPDSELIVSAIEDQLSR